MSMLLNFLRRNRKSPRLIEIPAEAIRGAAERTWDALVAEGGACDRFILATGGNLDPRAAGNRDRKQLQVFAGEVLKSFLGNLRG